jgi:two-component sensor histidine kinase
VSDEGEGLPANHDFDRATGLGMKVLRALAVQLGGKLCIGGNPEAPGVCAAVVWPLDC